MDRLPSSKAGNVDNDPHSRRATLTKMLFLRNAKAIPRKLLGWHSAELVIEIILMDQHIRGAVKNVLADFFLNEIGGYPPPP